VVGEIGLLDGEGHTMSVRASETATLLALGRMDFAALLARQDPSAFRLRRRLASLFTARHRIQLQHLAISLGGEPAGPPAEDAARAFAELDYCGPPDSKYVRRMATFHDFDPLALWGFLTSGRYARCPSGRTLLAEGAPSTACYLTINGAVEKVLVRGDRRIRVGLAGPGKAFGYESLIDGRPSPVTAITRERALLLVLPRDSFEQLFNGQDAVSRVFLDVIQRDLVATLRQTLRPNARLAASV
jgi:CRP-like cAMP-binding protein